MIKRLVLCLCFLLSVCAIPSGFNRVIRLAPAAANGMAHVIIVFELGQLESAHVDFHYTRAPRCLLRLSSLRDMANNTMA